MSNQNNELNQGDREQPFVSLFFEILCSAMGLDPESQEASEMIIPAYQEPENGPRPPRNKDLVYYYLMTDDTEGARYQTMEIMNQRTMVADFGAFSDVGALAGLAMGLQLAHEDRAFALCYKTLTGVTAVALNVWLAG